MFTELPKVEQDQWREQAADDHKTAMDIWAAENEGESSTLPIDRQRYVCIF
jgi:hypothetical protein